MHIAARYGHAAMINKLLEKGEKVDAVTNVRNGKQKIIRFNFKLLTWQLLCMHIGELHCTTHSCRKRKTHGSRNIIRTWSPSTY